MRETGTLSVELTGYDGDGATVILSSGGRTREVEYISGGGCAFTVETPERWISRSPRARQRAYATYDLRVITKGYVTVNVIGVQVFSGERSVQKIKMTRLDEADGQTERVIVIPEHGLYTPREAHSPEKSTPARSAGMNERRVFIPETIKVHLGAPGQNAANITAPFPYYVKNVASSEIFATWPENSLRANILCIISLALNRIYTEWYRSQGYDFDITSSTAFDQYFVPERNTFESINRIVDEIFTNYLAHAGHIEPLFAEYCDGRNVSCPGLSQWGTVTLANRGYTALGICRYYYGNDLEIREAPVERDEGSYPGKLSEGDDTRDVALLQYRLNRIAVNFPAMGFITDGEGVFGPTTKASVTAFQGIFGLNKTGVVDRETWYRVLYIYNAVKKLAELGSEGERVQGDAFNGRVLSAGDRGSEVLRMQYYLRRISDALGNSVIPRDKITGIFDDTTRLAVLAFQNYYGLLPTGVINQSTWDAIVKTYYALGEVDSGIKEYPGKPIRRGMSGEDVRYIQSLINAIAARVGGIRTLDEDGIFGGQTYEAVKEFQKFASLVPDGIVGPLTWEALNKTYGLLPTEASDSVG